MIENSLPHGRHIHNKPQPDKDRAGFPGFRQIRELRNRCTNDKKEPGRAYLLPVWFPCVCQCGDEVHYGSLLILYYWKLNVTVSQE